jgi:ribosomal protein S18 acetylase RimI-like enzyme
MGVAATPPEPGQAQEAEMADPQTGAWVIRDCRPDEAETLLLLWRQAGAQPSVTDTAEDVRRALTDGRAQVLAAESGGRLVGSLIASFDGWRGNLYRLAVHPDHRRRGIARALVAAGEERLARQGARRITALVDGADARALAFWNAVGYAHDPLHVRFARTF